VCEQRGERRKAQVSERESERRVMVLEKNEYKKKDEKNNNNPKL
jgi:hypothetical protein